MTVILICGGMVLYSLSSDLAEYLNLRQHLGIDGPLKSGFYEIMNIPADEKVNKWAYDAGWDDVSFHGSTQIPTPNLDALAADGIILNNFYAQPSCTPSRAALLTGLYPIHTGMQHLVVQAAEPWGLPLKYKLMPEYLKELGYETHMVGKWHLGYFTWKHTPTFRGFDTFYGFHTGEQDYYNHTFKTGDHLGLDFWLGTEPLRNQSQRYSTSLFTERATTIIKARSKEKPLFLFLSHQAVHSGIEVPFAAPTENIKKFPYIREENRTIFAAMTDVMDESVGAVIKALQDEGVLNNSIVVFISDNGGTSIGPHSTRSFNWPLRGTKLSLWEGGCRVPGFLWSPLLVKQGRVSQQLMHITDWLPTLYRAAGGNPDLLHVDGIDMWRQLSLDLPSPRTEILYNIDPCDNTSALRYHNHKLVLGSVRNGMFDDRIRTTGGSRPQDDVDDLTANSKVVQALRLLYNSSIGFRPKWREQAVVYCQENGSEGTNFVSRQPPYLFDLSKDPCELNNLASKEPELVALLRGKINRYATSAVPLENEPVDEKGFPENFDGVWSPWM
ncbi:arylsulfatase B-like [Haemaphysalis longicornis]